MPLAAPWVFPRLWRAPSASEDDMVSPSSTASWGRSVSWMTTLRLCLQPSNHPPQATDVRKTFRLPPPDESCPTDATPVRGPRSVLPSASKSSRTCLCTLHETFCTGFTELREADLELPAPPSGLLRERAPTCSLWLGPRQLLCRVLARSAICEKLLLVTAGRLRFCGCIQRPCLAST